MVAVADPDGDEVEDGVDEAVVVVAFNSPVWHVLAPANQSKMKGYGEETTARGILR